MNQPNTGAEPTWYEFHIRERLSPQFALWFEEMNLERVDEPGQPHTILRGAIQDQAALFGLIGRIRDLGLTLISVYPEEH